jgi:hypothetical protein
MTVILNTGRAAHAAGLCLLPVRNDGSKAPDVTQWRAFQKVRPTVEQMRAWNFADRDGIGVVAGVVSGYRECWDFDCIDAYNQFVEAAHACGLGDVVDRVRAGYEDATPGGGRRWIVTYPDSVEWRDCTLARRPGRDGEPKVKTLIELPTFAVLAPSNGATHPSGRPYVHLSGGFDTIAAYTVTERDALLDLARTFDQMPRPEAARPAQAATEPHGNRPGDAYNQQMTWPVLLESHGWSHAYSRGEVSYWRRPDKADGVSATTNYGDTDLFFPFTSSTEFAPDKSYSKFAVYAVLEHHGDFSKAALALSKQGYGRETISAAAAEPPPAQPETVLSLADLLDQVKTFVCRFVVMGTAQAIGHTLWIAHCHAIEAFDVTPYERIGGATMRCGKTLLQEVTAPLVPRAWLTGRTSAAVLPRKIEAVMPTLLLDETDAAFSRKGDDYSEALRGILNLGYTRSGTTTVCVGQGADITFKDFRTFCPKSLAGIGELPATLSDRCIHITLQRKKKSEHVARWRGGKSHKEAVPLYLQLEYWASTATQTLRAAEPVTPDSLNDRQAEIWAPLLAIADLAGGTWPEQARHAAMLLSGQVHETDFSVELLRDIATYLEETATDVDLAVATTDLLTALNSLPDRPWSTWSKGKPMTGRAFAVMLHGFEIIPSVYQLKKGDPKVARGYRIDAFNDSFARYELSKCKSVNDPDKHTASYASQSVNADEPVKCKNVNNDGTLLHFYTSAPGGSVSQTADGEPLSSTPVQVASPTPVQIFSREVRVQIPVLETEPVPAWVTAIEAPFAPDESDAPFADRDEDSDQ